MQLAVWDTYVKKKDDGLMHFDIIVPTTMNEPEIIYEYGRQYLVSKGQAGQPISSNECKFCHIESVKPEWEQEINRTGYFIFEMQNCD